jgi:hypothetical protein
MRQSGTTLAHIRATATQAAFKEKATMKPIAAGVAGALISGVAMYTLGAKTSQVDAFTQEPATAHAVDSQVVPAPYSTGLRPVAAPSPVPVRNVRRATTAPPQTPAPQPVYREPVQERESVSDEREIAREDDRSWGKTAMIIGGSAAGGAGVGGVVGGKKGALIGAAIGGGAASIYEATQRR